MEGLVSLACGQGDQISFARLGDSPWLRVTVVDAAGKRAWSNPYWR